MTHLYLYFCFLITMILQINLGNRGIALPLFVAALVFSSTILSFANFAIYALLFSLVSDLVMCGSDFSATMASIPFIVVMYFFDFIRKKNKPDGVTLSLFSIFPLFLFYIFYFFFSFFAVNPDLLRFALSLPVYLFMGVFVFATMRVFSRPLDIKEPERMVF